MPYLNICHLAGSIIDYVFFSIWKVAEFIMLNVCPLVLDYDRMTHDSEEYEIELEMHSRPNSDAIYEEIDAVDYRFQRREPIANKYYIGSYVYLPDAIVLGSVISPRIFFSYLYAQLHHYLIGYHVYDNPEQAIHILQLVEQPREENPVLRDVYFYHLRVVAKTYWIRIIQRTWKRVYRERMEVLRKWKSPDFLRIRETELTTQRNRQLPGIRRMLTG